MAQNRKRRHGKVEAKKIRPMIRFKLGVLILLIMLAFGGCFALYMVSALSQEDYWEKEIVGSSQTQQETEAADAPADTQPSTSAAVNPVPESPAADAGYMTTCAFLGNVTEFTTYCETASGMVFTDAVSVLTEDTMQNTAASLQGKQPAAVYLWYSRPEDPDSGLETLESLAGILKKKLPGVPLYILTALPAEADAEANRNINDWNAALFALAEAQELHYVDVSTSLKGNDGGLAAAYSDPEQKYTAVREEILTHVVS